MDPCATLWQWQKARACRVPRMIDLRVEQALGFVISTRIGDLFKHSGTNQHTGEAVC